MASTTLTSRQQGTVAPVAVGHGRVALGQGLVERNARHLKVPGDFRLGHLGIEQHGPGLAHVVGRQLAGLASFAAPCPGGRGEGVELLGGGRRGVTGRWGRCTAGPRGSRRGVLTGFTPRP